MYQKLGVDPSKHNVREIFAKLIDNEYPQAFVNIITDPFNSERVLTQHQDGDGSKFVQRLLHYFESGDESIFAGMADDALSMNTGDIAASGFVSGPWVITDVLNLNLPKDLKEIIMKQVAFRLLELRELYQAHGFNIKFLGGETADLPDQVRSGVFDIAITAWADKKDLISGNVQNGDVVFGVASDGRAVWETEDNSGIMSNGLTLARNCLMSAQYDEKYPQLKRDGGFYRGRFLYDQLLGAGNMTASRALLSPTRQWAIVIKKIIDRLKEAQALGMLHGITMNTGGGATKIVNVGGKGVTYVKNMPIPPDIFKVIQSETGEEWKNMFKSFNMGVGIDIIGQKHSIFFQAVKEAVAECQLSLYALGNCRRFSGSEKAPNKVWLETPFGLFQY
ncbi:MAG TPA: hypothetical protein PKI61_01525 [bacterium]|nr:hypothetical protein [bacterium]HPT29679.1 hypothetical protein [bacterium]